MSKVQIGYGVFGWDGKERRTNRYGSVHLDSAPYANGPVAKAYVHQDKLNELCDKRVQLTAVVVETRESGHIGDLSLGIKPSMPSVGEEIDLGVGIMQIMDSWDHIPAIALRPGDNRAEFWIDPRKLYRLHDQTVNLFAEETAADFTPAYNASSDLGAISNGDGSFQVKTKSDKPLRILPRIQKIEPGLFSMQMPGGPKGERFDIETEN